MSQKIALFLVVFVVLIGGFVIFVYANATEQEVQPSDNSSSADVLSPEQMEQKLKIVETFELQEKSKKLGLEVEGISEEELKDKVNKKETEVLIKKAELYDIDITGLDEAQIRQKIKLKEDFNIIEKVRNSGINTEGLTAEEVIKKVSEADDINIKNGLYPLIGESGEVTPEQQEKKDKFLLQDKARAYGINTEGLTEEEVKNLVEKKYKENKSKPSEIIAKAKKAGFKTDGLTDEQVIAMVNEDDKNLNSRLKEEEKKMVLGMAYQYEIDTTGLTYEQIEEKVYEKLFPTLLEKAKSYGIDPTGSDYKQLLKKVKEKECNQVMKDN